LAGLQRNKRLPAGGGSGAVENIDDAVSGGLSDKPFDLTIKPLKLRIAPFLNLQPDKA